MMLEMTGAVRPIQITTGKSIAFIRATASDGQKNYRLEQSA